MCCGEISVAHRFLRPHAQGQRFFADDAAARSKQMSQEQSESLGHRGNGRALEQQPSKRVESEVAETVDPRRGSRYRFLVRGLPLRHMTRTGLV